MEDNQISEKFIKSDLCRNNDTPKPERPKKLLADCFSAALNPETSEADLAIYMEKVLRELDEDETSKLLADLKSLLDS